MTYCYEDDLQTIFHTIVVGETKVVDETTFHATWLVTCLPDYDVNLSDMLCLQERGSQYMTE